MSPSPAEFFDLYCERWWQGALEEELPPGPHEQDVEYLRLLMAYLELSCLDMATKVQVRQQDLSALAEQMLASSRIEALPRLPVWLFLDAPQPVFGIDPSDQGSSWSDERVATLYFRAPYSTEVLSRSLIPPIGQRPFSRAMSAPYWYEWRLNLVDPQGIYFSAMQYYYDQRTGIWRKMEDATCPWDECGQAVDADLGYQVVLPCPQCQETLDYYSRWIATFLSGSFGQILHLRYAAWELRQRAFFGDQPTPSPLLSRRTFRGKKRRQQKRRS